jgi:SAM-dependent methyltransferase
VDRDYVKSAYEVRLSAGQPELVSDSDIQLKYILRYIPPQKNSTVLDAGCGRGRYVFKLTQLGYTDIYGIDLLNTKPQNAKNTYYAQATIDELPFPTDYFDFIYSNSVIYHLSSPEKGIAEFFRVLKPGGQVIVTAHTKYSLFTLDRVIKRFLGVKKVAHLRSVKFQSASHYTDLMRANGFEIVWIDGYRLSYFLHPLYTKLRTLLQHIFNVNLPQSSQRVTGNRVLARIKSELAYHMVIVARKAINGHF